MSRAEKSGIAKDMQAKVMAKFDPKLEREAIAWMEAVTKQKMTDKMAVVLHDGQYLCNLMNTLKPGAIPKVTTSTLAFKQMENINQFLKAIVAYGVPMSDTFQTIDLFEAKEGAGNMVQVIDTVHALGRAAQRKGYTGPKLGVKLAEAAPRQFSEETMKAGSTVIGLQAGFNRGASQAGMAAPGTTRHM
eukprot:scpid69529/ scgid24403/ Muscle-specific protein 20